MPMGSGSSQVGVTIELASEFVAGVREKLFGLEKQLGLGSASRVSVAAEQEFVAENIALAFVVAEQEFAAERIVENLAQAFLVAKQESVPASRESKPVAEHTGSSRKHRCRTTVV